jgi:hypothetical protein
MSATLNRWIGSALLAIGVCLIAVGIYLGLFAWLNDGPLAGLGVFGTGGAFGAATASTGLALRFAAAAHARSHPRRWWIQVAAIVAAYIAVGLAAEATSFLDRLARR